MAKVPCIAPLVLDMKSMVSKLNLFPDTEFHLFHPLITIRVAFSRHQDFRGFYFAMFEVICRVI